MSFHIRNICKKFGAFPALNDVTLEIRGGELLALLGPSGSGKTTLLRVLAGLETPDSGQVLLGETDVTRQHARYRNIGFVFQHYALFGHLSVFENVAFGLRVRRVKKDEVKKRVRELLELMQIGALENRFPSQLSGGQKQRVAFARALAARPEILLLDEPFGALDAKVRHELRRWLRELHDEIHLTSVFVTHDQEEAFEVADRVAIVNEGRIEQIGTPEEVFLHPATPFVLDFLGRVSVFKGRAQNGSVQLDGFANDFVLPDAKAQRGAATLYVRAHEWDIARSLHELSAHPSHALSADVARISRAGSTVKLHLRAGGSPTNSSLHTLEAELDTAQWQRLQLQTGDSVFVAPRQTRVFFER